MVKTQGDLSKSLSDRKDIDTATGRKSKKDDGPSPINDPP